MAAMRKSSRVSLVLIGLAALSGCGEDDTRRDVYKTREDCLADWGNKPTDCTPATESRHAGTGFFYGPAYGFRSGGSGSSWTRNATGNRAIGSSAVGSSGSSSVSRGGFGSSSRGASS
jgi:uncharacterized protein YgiB involved in biofilm formation